MIKTVPNSFSHYPNSKPMKLSVIIPCFNAAQTIGAQLEALANQCCAEPWEVIVADNGSTDNSMVVVKQFRDRLPNLHIVDASCQQGQAYARNMGAWAGAGEYLAFCDADDEVGVGWVTAMVEALAEADFVASRFEATKLNQAWALEARQLPQQHGLQEYKYPLYLPHASASGLGIKRSLHEAMGGFDESLRILEDTDYCWRLQLAGVKLHFAPNAIIHYRLRHNLSGIYSQACAYAEYNVLLYKKYQALGMPQLSFSLRANLKGWLRLLQSLPQIRCMEKRARWVWIFGWRMGRLQGCIKHRILAL
jgi:GT2 family glycosyltransferase